MCVKGGKIQEVIHNIFQLQVRPSSTMRPAAQTLRSLSPDTTTKSYRSSLSRIPSLVASRGPMGALSLL